VHPFGETRISGTGLIRECGSQRFARRREGHRRSGTARIFGHHDIADAAEQVEVAIDEDLAPAEIESGCRALLARLDAVAAERLVQLG
jgi:hypothetical protein